MIWLCRDRCSCFARFLSRLCNAGGNLNETLTVFIGLFMLSPYLASLYSNRDAILTPLKPYSAFATNSRHPASWW